MIGKQTVCAMDQEVQKHNYLALEHRPYFTISYGNFEALHRHDPLFNSNLMFTENQIGLEYSYTRHLERLGTHRECKFKKWPKMILGNTSSLTATFRVTLWELPLSTKAIKSEFYTHNILI